MACLPRRVCAGGGSDRNTLRRAGMAGRVVVGCFCEGVGGMFANVRGSGVEVRDVGAAGGGGGSGGGGQFLLL